MEEKGARHEGALLTQEGRGTEEQKSALSNSPTHVIGRMKFLPIPGHV